MKTTTSAPPINGSPETLSIYYLTQDSVPRPIRQNLGNPLNRRRMACMHADEATAAKQALLQRSIYVSEMAQAMHLQKLEMTMGGNCGPVTSL